MLHAGAAGGTQAQTLHARTGAGVLVLHARRGEGWGASVACGRDVSVACGEGR